VRSQAYAEGQHQQLQRRLERATEQLARLGERKQGKKRLTAREMAQAAEEIVSAQPVQDLLDYQVKTTTRSRRIRGYGDRAARVEKEQEHRVEVSRFEGVIERAKREMGWRVYATNHKSMTLAAVVWGYRGQNRLEDNFARLKGQPLGLTPLYLQYQSRIMGLVLLLSIALRLLSVLEWSLRKKLHEEGQTLKGLYPGQPGRQATRPSAELLLQAFKGIHLTVLLVGGQLITSITTLSALQLRLLELWDLPSDLYLRLTFHFGQPPSI
jgi:transposase